jgi:hypothetical protein
VLQRPAGGKDDGDHAAIEPNPCTLVKVWLRAMAP